MTRLLCTSDLSVQLREIRPEQLQTIKKKNRTKHTRAIHNRCICTIVKNCSHKHALLYFLSYAMFQTHARNPATKAFYRFEIKIDSV